MWQPVGVVPAVVLEGVPQRVHGRREVGELLEVLFTERLELPSTLIGEAQSHDAEVVGVLGKAISPALAARSTSPTALWGRSMR